MYPIILAGGCGSRLWPLSRAAFPKQLLALAGTHTLLQQTVLRLAGLNVAKPIVVCNQEHRFVVAEQLRAINQLGKIILEPVGRNTAPAVAIAALAVLEDDPHAKILVLAADHLIKDEQAFTSAINHASNSALNDKLITFGITPESPETGYGYIEAKETVQGTKALAVSQFKEKPDVETARHYIESGNFYWNSGIFLFKAKRFIYELSQYSADMLLSCKKAFAKRYDDLDFVRIPEAEFALSPSDSIDYAVMEHTKDAVVVPMSVGWSDLGSWHALWDSADKDEQGNVLQGDVLLDKSSNCYVNAQSKLVATVGVDNLVVVETKDAVLVANKEKVQDVKNIVNKLQQQQRCEATNHREVYRPWGMYDSIDNGHRYQVKHISVKPGEKLSIQMHHHRAEHWIVVSGTAKVTIGDDTFLVTENESTYIPIGERHALENPGKVALEMIEVQSGSYLGEDDIVRFDDRYGRSGTTN
nr:mannose-1-phosphate guanylyltransferase/mannose-6-phosphate isomerase [Paraferrimonas haliotis]